MVSAGAAWGAVFVAPGLAPLAPALLLATGRFLAFGAVSLPQVRAVLRARRPLGSGRRARRHRLGPLLRAGRPLGPARGPDDRRRDDRARARGDGAGLRPLARPGRRRRPRPRPRAGGRSGRCWCTPGPGRRSTRRRWWARCSPSVRWSRGAGTASTPTSLLRERPDLAPACSPAPRASPRACSRCRSRCSCWSTGGVPAQPVRALLVVLFLGLVSSWLAVRLWHTAAGHLSPVLVSQLMALETAWGFVFAAVVEGGVPGPLPAGRRDHAPRRGGRRGARRRAPLAPRPRFPTTARCRPAPDHQVSC